MGYFKSHIIPDWGDLFLDDVKAVKVEAWLGKLTKLDGKTPLADGTKAKLRNHLSALFSHCIRWELYDKANPIEQVRQSAKRKKVPETLDLVEIAGTLANIASTAIRVMVAVAAASALRRGEVQGLKWRDLNLKNHWFNLERGFVRKDETRMKTEASRKGLPMLPEFAELLERWRKETPYPGDDDPSTSAKSRLWRSS